jgi:hypothetical protein
MCGVIKGWLESKESLGGKYSGTVNFGGPWLVLPGGLRVFEVAETTTAKGEVGNETGKWGECRIGICDVLK